MCSSDLLRLCGEQIVFVENPAGYLTAQFESFLGLRKKGKGPISGSPFFVGHISSSISSIFLDAGSSDILLFSGSAFSA